MAEFPHLHLKQKIEGTYKPAKRKIEKKIDPQTQANLDDRVGHAGILLKATESLRQNRNQYFADRQKQGLPEIKGKEIIPLFLQIDTSDLDVESLKSFGIEIVSEEEGGFIIGASADDFQTLGAKIQQFMNNAGQSKNLASRLWQIVQGTQWRIDYILSDSLKEKYVAGIDDEELFVVDISIACYIKFPDKPILEKEETDDNYSKRVLKWQESLKKEPDKIRPEKRPRETDEHYSASLDRWSVSMQKKIIEKDNLAMSRQDYLEDFIVNIYNGEILSSYIDMEDSFGFRAKMSGKALKDLLNTYPYVFEMCERDIITETIAKDNDDILLDIEILKPEVNSPSICIIDSGIQQEHILLAPAFEGDYSKNYVPNETTTADLVSNGGHGTKVAGAVLYGNEIPSQGIHQLHCFLLNARILDANNQLSDQLYPPALMQEIVNDYDDIRLFNMSVSTKVSCRTTHMSAWAAMIDKLIHERQILFILAAGNLSKESRFIQYPGISNHLLNGKSYPDYLLEDSSRVANPAQSLLGLTVGSVCLDEFEDDDRISFGKKGYVSSFSRSGLGMWGSIKPDVVEFGGDWLREKNGHLLTTRADINPLLVKTGVNGVGHDLGTSFSAPKVMHIASKLQKLFPDESVLMYKALIIQSARLPEHVFYNPTKDSLKLLGYGIANLERATQNKETRITFVASGAIAPQQANLYSISLPEEIRKQGQDIDVLIEVTLAFTAIPRRTRKGLKSYLSSWASWESSKLRESFNNFKSRIIKDIESPEEAKADQDSIRWMIWSTTTSGIIPDIKRQDSATQKDWVIVKSNALPEELSFAVIGHKGWEKDTSKEIPFALTISIESLSGELPIYSKIKIANEIEIEQETEIIIDAAGNQQDLFSL